ncbi:hypothetical protein VU11_06675, partial [Desulfobulbus sp. US2]|nr:hypothetical protein [Desulfobulbus sp. US2]
MESVVVIRFFITLLFALKQFQNPAETKLTGQHQQSFSGFGMIRADFSEHLFGRCNIQFLSSHPQCLFLFIRQFRQHLRRENDGQRYVFRILRAF